MAKENEYRLSKPRTFRDELILLILMKKEEGVSLDEIESALHCEIDAVKTQLSALNKTKKKKA